MELALDDLVQESEKLLMEVQEDNDLPRITRTLDQMRNLGEKLYISRGSHSDVKAARLLGPNMGYELPHHLSSKLEALSTTESVEITPAVPELDIQSFLRNERESALLNAICLTQKAVFEEIEGTCDFHLQNWWKQEAVGVLSALAGSGGPLDTELSYPADTDSGSQFDYNRENLSMHLTREELSYANQLDRYLAVSLTNPIDFSSLQTDPSRNLLGYLARSQETQPNDRNPNMQQIKSAHYDVLELWNLMTRISDRLQTEKHGINRCDRSSELRTSSSVQNRLLLCSLDHLESEFAEFLRVIVSSQPHMAKLGGRPGTRSLVRAYLSIQFPGVNASTLANVSVGNFSQDQSGVEFEDGFIDSKPVWCMIFYCLRAGDTGAAIEIAREAVNNLGNFANVLEDYIQNNRHVQATTQSRFRQTCRQIIKTTRDPYKRILYSILGHCDTNDNHSEVATTIDDFLWLKISQVLSGDPCELSNVGKLEDTLTLSQLQILLYETYGEVHFDAWSQPLVYFKILCLTQQYEAAIGFLSRFESLRCHAVHIALALKDMNLLLLPSWLHSPLISRNDSDPTAFHRLNLARLVMLYTRKFEINDPAKALMYFYLLNDIKFASSKTSDSELNNTTNNLNDESSLCRKKDHNLFTTCVCELALATRELELLLGSVNDAGIRRPGAIDRYCRTPESRQELIRTVAQAFASRGQVIEAVLLYQLASTCGNPKSDLLMAVCLLNSLLSSLVSTSNLNSAPQTPSRTVGQPDRNVVMQLATELAHKIRHSSLYMEDHLDSSFTSDDTQVNRSASSTIKTLFYLLDIAAFFDLVEAEQWQAAIDHMDHLGLFPSNPQPAHVESRVSLFSRLPDLVRRPLPWALYALMRCLSAKSGRSGSVSRCRSASQNENVIKMNLPEVRNRARALIAFVGRIPHRLPSEIYARLTQMDMEIT